MFEFKFILLLLISFHQFSWSRCDGISSILFPFNAVVDQSLENKNQERNLSLRNRYQASYSSTNTEYKSQFANTNLLNKLTLDNKQNSKSSNSDRTIVVPDLYCEKDEWLCNDKLRCISKAAVCNNVQDCIDSSDEIGCIGSCRGDEFRCKNSKCIDEKYICDSFDDCGDWSDELNCIGTGKIPKLTGNLKLDLDSFESIENQNLVFPTPKQSEVSQTDPNHPNKHPDTFNSQLNKQFNLKFNQQNQLSNHSIQPNHPNRQPDKNHNQSTFTSATTRSITIVTSTPSPNESSNQAKELPKKLGDNLSKEMNRSNAKSIENKTISTNYEAPYIKIFPLTPVLKNTETMTPSRVGFNNYAILSNKPVNSTDKNLIESLGFGMMNNNNKSLKQEAFPIKTMKPDQTKTPENKPISQIKLQNSLQSNSQNGVQSKNMTQNTTAQALTGQELANEKKNLSSKKPNDKIKSIDKSPISAQSTNKENKVQTIPTSIDVSKSNSGGQRLAFSISLPKATEATAQLKQESGGRKNKSKDSKEENPKKLNCKRLLNQKINDPNLESCKHCSYGLFRCLMGKCVITSFECGANATNTTKGRRVSVNVNDFLQFV